MVKDSGGRNHSNKTRVRENDTQQEGYIAIYTFIRVIKHDTQLYGNNIQPFT